MDGPGTLEGRWRLDSGGSRVAFRSATLWGAIPVRGTLVVSGGHLRVHGEQVEGNVTASTESVDTGLSVRDRHLCSPLFLDAHAHPAIEFRLRSLRPRPSGWVAEGNLQLGERGHAVDVPLELVPPRRRDVVVLDWRTQVDRFELGVEWNLARMVPATVELDGRVCLRRA